MKSILFTLALTIGLVPVMAKESTLTEAEKNAAIVNTLVLDGSANQSKRLLKLAPKLVALESVIIQDVNDEKIASDLVSSVAACNTVRTITFRNCVFQELPTNLRMLTQIKSFNSENTSVSDGEQFYNTIADMPNLSNVTVTGSDFQTLPKSFARLRVMDDINLVNNDMQLVSGYDRNNKTAEELRATETVVFGFGDDALNLNYTCYNADAAKSHVSMFRDVLQGAFRASNVFYQPIQSKAYVKSHPLVKPPVKGLDVYPDVYSYRGMTGGEIEYGSGTTISIPANAFEDANGALVTGNIDITYREFRDPVDIVLSGIPMTYDTGGVVENFESAGMFEINASQNGNEVYLREGVKIDMNFAVVDTASTFNFYRLDEKKGWEYIESTGEVEREMIPAPDSVKAPWSEAVSYYVDNLTGVRSFPLTADTTSFDRRYADTSYFGTHKYANSAKRYQQKERRKASSKLYFRKYGTGPDYTLIKVERNYYYAGNPELGAYSGYYWKLDGKKKSSQLKPDFGRKAGINDIRVVDEGGQYYLELKYHWGFTRVAVEPVSMDRNGDAKSISDRMKQTLFKNYTRRLEHREKNLTRDLAHKVKQHNRRNVRASKDSVKVFNRTMPKMNEAETGMDFSPWNSYVRSERIRTASAAERAFIASGEAVQALQLQGMGVFNCDQVKRLDHPVKATVKKIAVGAAAVVPFIVYVIDKAKNMVLTYTGNGGGPVRVTYGGQATNTLMMVDGDGNLYMSDENQFKEGAVKGGDGNFNATMVSGPFSTPESVRESVFKEE
jgi:hypothetical protein